jgi:hypothetical protein
MRFRVFLVLISRKEDVLAIKTNFRMKLTPITTFTEAKLTKTVCLLDKYLTRVNFFNLYDEEERLMPSILKKDIRSYSWIVSSNKSAADAGRRPADSKPAKLLLQQTFNLTCHFQTNVLILTNRIKNQSLAKWNYVLYNSYTAVCHSVYIFLVWMALVLRDACCKTRQQLVLLSHWHNPLGKKPARPGPLIFEVAGRPALSVGKAAGVSFIHLNT